MLKRNVKGVRRSQTNDRMLPVDGASAPMDDPPLGMIMTVPEGTRPTSRSGALRGSCETDVTLKTKDHGKISKEVSVL